MKIAIIEDEKELNLLIKSILEKEGFEVESFFDGESILQQDKKYDLYLIDLNLPKLNGLDLLDLIDGKKMVISVNLNPKIIDLAYSKGIEDFIKKPFIKEEFLHKIYKIFPKKVNIKKYLLMPNERILQKEDKLIILTQDEAKFLSLFAKKDIVTFEEIKTAIQKENNALYVFLSKLKKKTGIDFENIKNLGYKIKD